MKKNQLDTLGFVELTNVELEETNGGFLPLIIIGVILLAGCSGQGQNNQNNGSGTQINIQCTNCTVINNGDTVKVAPKK